MRHKKKTKGKKSSKSKKLSTFLPNPSKGKNGSTSPGGRVIKRRMQYSSEKLIAAFHAVNDTNISVNAAAKQFGVPLTTLRDRVDGRIPMGTKRPGPSLLMEKDEESEIVHFLQTMAKYGYRYTRQELAEIATDQAVEKGKRKPYANGLTTKWVDCFINRWPSVKDLSCKFKSNTDPEQTVRIYFDEIKKIIDRYKLLDKRDRIFNIMEVNLQTDHRVQPGTGKSHHSDDNTVTNTTLIACGSVSGRVLAPFLIFQANRIKPEMMTRVPSNVNASISETGRCCPQIFRRYLNDHFLPQARRLDNGPILVLMDGVKSHMFVGMSEWGRTNNVIFSFVPHHTTHLLQPLEVECGEAIVKKYEKVCAAKLRESHSLSISRNCIGELACQAYSKAMTCSSVMYSFKKAGVFPEGEDDDSDGESDSYRPAATDTLFTSEEQDHVDEVVYETVFTEDLVVGQNQEVTGQEEEVRDSHMVGIQDTGGMFINLHGLELIPTTKEVDVKPDLDTLNSSISDTSGEELGLRVCVEPNYQVAASSSSMGGLLAVKTEIKEEEEGCSAARTRPLSELISRQHRERWYMATGII